MHVLVGGHLSYLLITYTAFFPFKRDKIRTDGTYVEFMFKKPKRARPPTAADTRGPQRRLQECHNLGSWPWCHRRVCHCGWVQRRQASYSEHKHARVLYSLRFQQSYTKAKRVSWQWRWRGNKEINRWDPLSEDDTNTNVHQIDKVPPAAPPDNLRVLWP